MSAETGVIGPRPSGGCEGEKKRHRLQQKTSQTCTGLVRLKDRLVKLVMTGSPQCNRTNLQSVLEILWQKKHTERSDIVAKMDDTLVGKGPASPIAKVDCARTKARALRLPLEPPKASAGGSTTPGTLSFSLSFSSYFSFLFFFVASFFLTFSFVFSLSFSFPRFCLFVHCFFSFFFLFLSFFRHQ